MPSDETLVRTIVAWQFSVEDIAIPLDFCFGALAFDGGAIPGFYELGSFANGSSAVAPPHPFVDGDDDWIIRVPGQFVSRSGFPQFVTSSTELFEESRAMRKLPPGTGVLGVLGFINVTNTTSVIAHVDWSIDCRMALRSGYTR